MPTGNIDFRSDLTRRNCLYIALVGTLTTFASSGVAAEEDVLRATFERKYAAWREHMRTPKMIVSSGLNVYDSVEFRELVGMGPPVVGWMLEKVSADPYAYDLIRAVSDITRRRFPQQDRLEIMSTREKIAMWASWWKGGAALARREFDEAYAKWRAAKTKDKMVLWTTRCVYDEDETLVREAKSVTDLGRAYRALVNLGVGILPFVLEGIERGDWDLLPILAGVTRGEGAPHTLSREDRKQFALEWWRRNKTEWLLRYD